MTTSTRTPARHGRRASYSRPVRLDLRAVPPITRRAMRRAWGLGTLTVVSVRTLAVASVCSALGVVALGIAVGVLVLR